MLPLVLTMAGLLVADGNIALEIDAQRDLQQLQGTWILQRVIWRGEIEDQNPDWHNYGLMRRDTLVGEEWEEARDQANWEVRLTIKGYRFVYEWPDFLETLGTFRLKVRQHPKVIERHSVAFRRLGGCRFEETEDTYRSIYSLEGNTLKWGQRIKWNLHDSPKEADAEHLPGSFETRPGDDLCVLIFERDRSGSPCKRPLWHPTKFLYRPY